MLKADLVLQTVKAPSGRLCASGHIPPEKIGNKPMTWIRVGKKQNTGKVYCEACMRIANHVKWLKKNEPDKWVDFALKNGLRP